VSRSTFTRLVFAAETIILTCIVVVVVHLFVAQPFRIERESMQETLREGQMILVDKLTPRLTGLARGDIVVFAPPERDGRSTTPFIKRVIGLPGDLVEIRDGLVYVNGTPLDESAYVYHGQPTEPVETVTSWYVPDGMLFVLGDHRADSTDSRSAWPGTIPQSSVIGRAALRYWPPGSMALLTPPAYPELRAATAGTRAAAAPGDQPGPATQASIARP
jgi:signal peptidase I